MADPAAPVSDLGVAAAAAEQRPKLQPEAAGDLLL